MYVLLAGVFLVGATTCDAQILHKKKKVNKSTGAENNAQPDKVLYDKAMDNIKHGRQEVGRLSMQTLINTYPDSEYLAKAKLAIADSFYKEGGSANMTQAIASYKDFIVFFPFLPEATYAQIQVAMAHFRQMEKPDRDRTQARAAEDEFQTFLQKYPNDPLAPQAEQRLREVQEVLAEGDFRIGSYYYIKGDRRAAASRLLAVTKRYPLYSRADHANWMLGDIFEKSEHKEIATMYYSQIVKDYPLSPLAAGAKDKLKAFGAPIPQPDPGALAWMKEEQNIPRKHATLLLKPMGLVKNGPGGELRAAARTGKPNLEPEADTFSATDILTGGGKSQIGGSGGGTTGIVATVVTGGSETAPSTGGTGTDGGAQPAEGSTTNSTTAPTTPDPPKESAPPATDASPANSSNTSANGNSTSPTSAAADSANTSTPASDSKTDANAPAAQNSDATKAADEQGDSQKSNDSSNKKESSSKKKKGLRKIIPW